MSSLPLQGKRIVITRRAEQVAELGQLVTAAGGIPLSFPTIVLKALPAHPLMDALKQPVDWLLFTSANGVRFFAQVLADAGIPLPPVRIAASGSSTAAVLQQHNLPVHYIPDEFVGEALIAGLGDVAGQRILLPRARRAREKVADLLRQRGATVVDIPLYDTVPATPDPAALRRLVAGYDALTVTSPSTLHNFLRLNPDPLPPDAVVAAIGPVTAQAALEAGLTGVIVPGDWGTKPEFTLAGLVAVLAAYYAGTDEHA